VTSSLKTDELLFFFGVDDPILKDFQKYAIGQFNLAPTARAEQPG